jgi:peroxidase
MISSTPNNIAKRDLCENNIAQNAFDAIVQVKKAVDSVCPRVVSCADIIALAARDAVRLVMNSQ